MKRLICGLGLLFLLSFVSTLNISENTGNVLKAQNVEQQADWEIQAIPVILKDLETNQEDTGLLQIDSVLYQQIVTKQDTVISNTFSSAKDTGNDIRAVITRMYNKMPASTQRKKGLDILFYIIFGITGLIGSIEFMRALKNFKCLDVSEITQDTIVYFAFLISLGILYLCINRIANYDFYMLKQLYYLIL